jgi:hypothetical protein
MDILEQIKKTFGLSKPKAPPAQSQTTTPEIVVEKKPVADEEMLKRILESIQLITKDVSEKLQGAENRVTAVETKIKDDSQYKVLDERVKKLEAQLDQFTKVYELITSQYSPFTTDGPKAPIKTKPAADEKNADVTSRDNSEQKSPQSQTAQSSQPQAQPSSPVQVFIQTSPASVSTQQPSTTSTFEQNMSSSSSKANSRQNKNDGDFNDNLASTLTQNDSNPASEKSVTKPKIPASFAIDAPIEHAFVTFSNHSITSIPQLAEVLGQIDDDEFSEFVTPNRNDFATWVKDVLQDADFAQKMSAHKTRSSLREFITSFLG